MYCGLRICTCKYCDRFCVVLFLFFVHTYLLNAIAFPLHSIHQVASCQLCFIFIVIEYFSTCLQNFQFVCCSSLLFANRFFSLSMLCKMKDEEKKNENESKYPSKFFCLSLILFPSFVCSFVCFIDSNPIVKCNNIRLFEASEH